MTSGTTQTNLEKSQARIYAEENFSGLKPIELDEFALRQDAFKAGWNAKETLNAIQPDEQFNFCIGRYWDETENNNLCVYALGMQVHYGNIEQARSLLKYVLNHSDEKDYQIFKILPLNNL